MSSRNIHYRLIKKKTKNDGIKSHKKINQKGSQLKSLKRKSSRKSSKRSSTEVTSLEIEQQLCNNVSSCSKELMEAADINPKQMGEINSMSLSFMSILADSFRKAFKIMKAILGLIIVSLPGGEFIKTTTNNIYQGFKYAGQAISNFTQKAYQWGKEKTMIGVNKLKNIILNNKKISLAIATITVVMSTIFMCKHFKSKGYKDIDLKNIPFKNTINTAFSSLSGMFSIGILSNIFNSFKDIVISLITNSSKVIFFFRNKLSKICGYFDKDIHQEAEAKPLTKDELNGKSKVNNNQIFLEELKERKINFDKKDITEKDLFISRYKPQFLFRGQTYIIGTKIHDEIRFKDDNEIYERLQNIMSKGLERTPQQIEKEDKNFSSFTQGFSGNPGFPTSTSKEVAMLFATKDFKDLNPKNIDNNGLKNKFRSIIFVINHNQDNPGVDVPKLFINNKQGASHMQDFEEEVWKLRIKPDEIVGYIEPNYEQVINLVDRSMEPLNVNEPQARKNFYGLKINGAKWTQNKRYTGQPYRFIENDWIKLYQDSHQFRKKKT